MDVVFLMKEWIYEVLIKINRNLTQSYTQRIYKERKKTGNEFL